MEFILLYKKQRGGWKSTYSVLGHGAQGPEPGLGPGPGLGSALPKKRNRMGAGNEFGQSDLRFRILEKNHAELR